MHANNRVSTTTGNATDCNGQPLPSPELIPRTVSVDFAAGFVSSDEHGLLLAQLDRGLGHLDGKVKGELRGGKTWHQRSHRWPDHLLDAEKEQVAMALFYLLLPWAAQKSA